MPNHDGSSFGEQHNLALKYMIMMLLSFNNIKLNIIKYYFILILNHFIYPLGEIAVWTVAHRRPLYYEKVSVFSKDTRSVTSSDRQLNY